ncbi:TPA: hypothetical protein N0F65_002783 [Lagenidium giganteum]|uniref:Uncharacterized protein n=1 Tax=Lagenidium giganteum TaxID=4803 RepID=A0AAV2YNW0_9STRA|nr:TPA: hypothetical protein N0F65_002783 [Lagenidium giganteum]
MATEGGGDDLYAGIDLSATTPKTDAAAVDEKAAGDTIGAVADRKRASSPPRKTEEPNAKRRALDSLDLNATIDKLKNHMLVDKKFAKASKLFCTLMSEKLTAKTAPAFLSALVEMIDAQRDVWSGKKEFVTLVDAVAAREELLSQEERQTLQDWKFLAHDHAQLFTDDTFQFVKAAKVVKARLEAVDEQSEPGIRKRELELVMPLLRTLFAKHTTAWAKAMVETVLQLATRKRLLFTDAQREEVDKWTKAIHERRHAPAIGRSAASEARRNTISHEEQLSSATGVKVGRSNHPLFNKDA